MDASPKAGNPAAGGAEMARFIAPPQRRFTDPSSVSPVHSCRFQTDACPLRRPTTATATTVGVVTTARVNVYQPPSTPPPAGNAIGPSTSTGSMQITV